MTDVALAAKVSVSKTSVSKTSASLARVSVTMEAKRCKARI